MIVRLKERIDNIDTCVDLSFQFYDSPIKRIEKGFYDNPREIFQFYDSPIKRSELTYKYIDEIDISIL